MTAFVLEYDLMGWWNARTELWASTCRKLSLITDETGTKTCTYSFWYIFFVHKTTGKAPANIPLSRDLRLPCDLKFGCRLEENLSDEDYVRAEEWTKFTSKSV